MRQANANMLVLCQLESARAYENLDAILEVEGIDGYVFGPNDLAQSMGLPGQPGHPDDRFMERAIARTEAIVQADPRNYDTMLGAQASSEQKEKILSYFDIGRQEGAEVLTGGTDVDLGGDLSGGYYVKPTILKGHNKMRVFQEESLGGSSRLPTHVAPRARIAPARPGASCSLRDAVWGRDMTVILSSPACAASAPAPQGRRLAHEPSRSSARRD